MPVGTASLAAEDADSCPDLTPWLASVFVVPDRRGRGYGRVLVAAVECAARLGGFSMIWLFTDKAAGLCASLGWCPAGSVKDHGRRYLLIAARPRPSCRVARFQWHVIVGCLSCGARACRANVRRSLLERSGQD
ncbi:GNAT family N-acetyltransferase [Elioraea tepida]|uniref:GNAT family N-acetyltransferase n=1 Tax=Elioraea tepida TaxID=2843330 RepID=A0A975YIT5_9PROT|nr:GNAT family N-acetyltransferase [Elioraea tepida]